jgi:tetratricopeptide (TPR) repeat protein
MLETIRDYARDRLVAAGEADEVESAHARHYLEVAENLASLREKQHFLARDLAETELDNFREALGWSLLPDGAGTSTTDRALTGLRICFALNFLWLRSGHFIEGRRWYENVIARAGDSSSPELAACLGQYANLLLHGGDLKSARDVASRSLKMARALGEAEGEAVALGILGTVYQQWGNVDDARTTFEEALEIHRKSGTTLRLANALGNLAGSEVALGNFAHAEDLMRESVSALDQLGDRHEATVQRQNLANLLALAGHVEAAADLARSIVDTVLKLRSPNLTLAFANTCMNILIRLGEPAQAAHLFGAEEAMRERDAMPNPFQQEELEETLALVEGMISVDDWNHHCRIGRSESLQDLLAGFGATEP